MQVKKYRARTIKEAIAMVKNGMGPEAMILSTKKLGNEGQEGLFEIAALPGADGSSQAELSPLGEVKSELMTIREMIYLLNASTSTLERTLLNPALIGLYAQLIRSGLKDQYARLFIEKAGALNGVESPSSKRILDSTMREIMQVIEVKDPFRVSNSRQIVAAFIGTTGVGKTTTIAKLAAQLMLKAGKKVGLVSIDNYRIGAMEQLKTYAHILGIPCFPAFSRKDLLSALRRMERNDVVLIDTAGQSHYDKARIEELRKMMTDDLAISTHLLLSVATTESEMNQTALNFSPLKFESYVFTKIDEAERCGSVINQVMKLPAPISYITTGQNVPEDIEKAEKRRILQLLFNTN